MAKKYFLPQDKAGRMMWFKNFVVKLPSYQQKYNLSAGSVQELADSEAVLVYWVGYQVLVQKYTDSIAEYIKALQNGNAIGLAVPQPPVFVLPTFVPAPGMIDRATAMGNIIKSNIAYNVGDGRDLGLEGTEINQDLLTIKPPINIRLIAGGHPEIVWQKQGMDGIEIYKDNGNGQFVMLAYDSHPNYIDNSPLPAQGQSAAWNYKAIYRLDDETVGLWSDVVSISVMG